MDRQKWIQYSASHVATTVHFGSKMASEAIPEHLISKNFLGEHVSRPPYPSLAYLYASDFHVTPLVKILAIGLLIYVL